MKSYIKAISYYLPENVLLAGFGVGYSWGAAIIKWA